MPYVHNTPHMAVQSLIYTYDGRKAESHKVDADENIPMVSTASHLVRLSILPVNFYYKSYYSKSRSSPQTQEKFTDVHRL